MKNFENNNRYNKSADSRNENNNERIQETERQQEDNFRNSDFHAGVTGSTTGGYGDQHDEERLSSIRPGGSKNFGGSFNSSRNSSENNEDNVDSRSSRSTPSMQAGYGKMSEEEVWNDRSETNKTREVWNERENSSEETWNEDSDTRMNAHDRKRSMDQYDQYSTQQSQPQNSNNRNEDQHIAEEGSRGDMHSDRGGNYKREGETNFNRDRGPEFGREKDRYEPSRGLRNVRGEGDKSRSDRE